MPDKGGNKKRGRRLAKKKAVSNAQVLTQKDDRLTVPFEIAIRHSLNNAFSFDSLDKNGLTEFHRFIEKTVGKKLDWEKVDSTLLRKSNGSTFRDEYVDGADRKIRHYELSSKGRIFGYREGNDFIVWKIDPNHVVDKS